MDESAVLRGCPLQTSRARPAGLPPPALLGLLWGMMCRMVLGHGSQSSHLWHTVRLMFGKRCLSWGLRRKK
eukprot:CAMPEP_0194332718 /NCGR_PEP_ID=MMETSP0171-20130528/60073_1 /TAXON_ID=218684 /ORGANISM="Corethron pennatum, Strain L29A3" /LENGTH=70 /DNA_ID=CAMNT_0039094687 /DNA_START=87 /DNA_END=296 /DNA_ORIENTATION=-